METEESSSCGALGKPGCWGRMHPNHENPVHDKSWDFSFLCRCGRSHRTRDTFVNTNWESLPELSKSVLYKKSRCPQVRKSRRGDLEWFLSWPVHDLHIWVYLWLERDWTGTSVLSSIFFCWRFHSGTHSSTHSCIYCVYVFFKHVRIRSYRWSLRLHLGNRARILSFFWICCSSVTFWQRVIFLQKMSWRGNGDRITKWMPIN